ncbi:uncharacterized protein LOC121263167 [Juglans microcarpa x Juglans regia]|uniref:uncharacterized protein LOC121263167 n=1 Tax=Juglans microcarpa x Juglans regia TaxID=2249226 RepID=UPI001B7DB2EB|nr:uncharacterized protein LOC121263167 [Juglans microcarpa x Juglans regia]
MAKIVRIHKPLVRSPKLIFHLTNASTSCGLEAHSRFEASRSEPADALSSMASSAPPSSGPGVQNPRRPMGLLANAMKRKDSFIQFFAMTGILLLSIRSLGQKYRIHDLQEDTSALIEERDTLTERMKNIKHDLLHEASLDPTGFLSSRLRLLFGEED